MLPTFVGTSGNIIKRSSSNLHTQMLLTAMQASPSGSSAVWSLPRSRLDSRNDDSSVERLARSNACNLVIEVKIRKRKVLGDSFFYTMRNSFFLQHAGIELFLGPCWEAPVLAQGLCWRFLVCSVLNIGLSGCFSGNRRTVLGVHEYLKTQILNPTILSFPSNTYNY